MNEPFSHGKSHPERVHWLHDHPGQTLENPVTGERFTFTHTAASTGGELLAFDFALRPGGAVPIPHVHPIQTERFEVIDGLMRFRVGLRKRLRARGTSRSHPAGHSFANAGPDEARLRVEVRPALAMEDSVRRGRRDGADRANDTSRPPRSPLDSPCSRASTTRRPTRRCSASACSACCSPCWSSWRAGAR